jgi:very-short-patch-repair endonuclease
LTDKRLIQTQEELKAIQEESQRQTLPDQKRVFNVPEKIREKSRALIEFFKDFSTLRRKRVPTYRENDKLLWFYQIPRGCPEIRSAFFADKPDEFPDLWLEVQKKRKPTLPVIPKELQDWVPPKFQSSPEEYLDRRTEELLEILNSRITVLVKRSTPNSNMPSGDTHALTEKVSEERRLEDYPDLQDTWLDYLVNRWELWAQEMRRWQEIQRVYENVDFMRRRLEEAEERYELMLGVGLLVWRDPTGTTVKRHLLTAPAEISLDAARGILTVSPAASFDSFRIELDMLELQHQPRLKDAELTGLLEELDVQAWDRAKIGEILRVIANKASPDAQVDESSLEPPARADDTFRVIYAPALVLRERRPTAYDELITRLLERADDAPLPLPPPWERFINEGELSGGGVGTTPEGPKTNSGLADSRLYFPLLTNEEQRRIAECLRAKPYVLVKGPPGTGKSHTIANLICHLLATGERVLVTAHAPKALTVLRELLPREIRNLCVTAFGSSREDHRLLEDSVRGILSRKNEWKGPEWAQGEIDQLEKELCQLEDEIAKVDRQLRECRESETHSHTLPGGYRGTAAQIARQIERERERYGWFPELADDQKRCPLQPEDISLLAEVHAVLTQERLNEIQLQIGTFSLPDPRTFEETINKLIRAENVARAACAGVHKEQLDALQWFSYASLDACRAFLNQLEEQATRASRTLGDLTDEILKDLLVGQSGRWDHLEREAVELLEKIQDAHNRAGTARVDIPPDIENTKLLSDGRRRLEHLKNGGRRGWGFLAPRVMRETRYIEQACRVNGEPPRQKDSLEMLVGYLELREHLERFCAVWPAVSAPRLDDPRRAASEVRDLVEQFLQFLKLFRDCGLESLAVVPIEKREALAQRDERAAWRGLINAELARRLARSAKKPLDEWLRMIHGDCSQNHHPCMWELAKAIEDRDPAQWRSAWEIYQSLRKDKDRFSHYEKLLNQLQVGCPELVTLILSTQGDPEWTNRLHQLQQAWDWAAAKAWLRKVTDPELYARLAQKRHRLQSKTEKKLEELATLRAWHAFFSRLDDATEQNLTAWTKAVARIGRGTGKYAYRHRRTARKYLMSCVPKIPAWIMPLHKLWETVDPTPGVFDTVIVDEASQAGIEALVLLLLAKRIIVVGDDKQNSPEAVGVLEDDIARLVRKHLRDFLFRDEFRPDASLYDHAERAFGNVISLREHFRCVPEIIRFSNGLCYTDAPLIPLRQPPPNRLPPLKAVFVDTGNCEGEGQRIINRAEAEAIVKTIQECLSDEAYEGKTMGVIVLQGHAQAEFIGRRLAEVLDPKVCEERKLRCGVPATFQGDQRDVIFLSLVVAPNHTFRALTELEAQRRFNVAMSRARDQVWLFHSVQLHDLSRDDLRRTLLHFFLSPGQADGLYEELDRLEREAKKPNRQPGEQPDPYDSWFEVDVALELLRRNYRVRPQVEVAGYRIDLVVEGLTNRLALECDGEAWHGLERFEQDMARQRQLERAGWTFVRIRESEFYADRKGAVRRIVEACEELGIQPIGQEEQEVDKEAERSIAVEEDLSQESEEKEGRPDLGEAEEDTIDRATRDQGPAPVAQYSQQLNFPDPREATTANVQAALLRLIEEEGPLTVRLLIKLYVEGCPTLQRAGKAVRNLLNRALYGMQRAGEILIEDELGDRSPESQVVRLSGVPRVRERPAGRRDLLEIPPSELLLVIDRMQTSSTSSAGDDEELARALLAHYGFTRLTEARKKHILKILNVYRRHKRDSKSGGAT